LPFKEDFFDLCFTIEVIEHIYDTDFFLQEIHRVLKENGIMILTTPNLASLLNRIKLLFGRYPYLVPSYDTSGAGHIQAYTLSVLEKQVSKHGFKVLTRSSEQVPFR